MNTVQNHYQSYNCGDRTGKLFVAGIGPGRRIERTLRAEEAINASSVVAGYTLYLEWIEDLTEGKEVISSGMTREKERCRLALQAAASGKVVSLISSGDPGIYGMAGLALEMAAADNLPVPIEIIPGVSAASTAAARLGAPLMTDFACISLSDLLVSWEVIRQRLEAVAACDLTVALYNPRSRKRVHQLEDAAAIFRKYRRDSTPVGIGTALGSCQETVIATDLGHFLDEKINMRSIVIIGNSTSRMIGNWFVTPRGYSI